MNEELTKIFDSMPEGVVMLQQDDNKVKLANTEFKRLFRVRRSVKSNQLTEQGDLLTLEETI